MNKIDIEWTRSFPHILYNVFLDMILSGSWKTKCLFCQPGLVLIDEVQSPDTYILIMIEGIEYIIRKAGEEVDQEPWLHVVDPDNSGITDHFTPGSNICGVEVEDNVNEEYHINNGVDHK